MKQIKYVTIFILFTLAISSCVDKNPIQESGYSYSVELKITNESASEKNVGAETFVIYDDISESYCEKIESLENVSIAAGKTENYNFDVSLGLCVTPKLSHVINIDNIKFAGFDTDFISVMDEETGELSKIKAAKNNLGTVNWKNDAVEICYEGKSFGVTDSDSVIKLIYDMTITDDVEKSEVIVSHK